MCVCWHDICHIHITCPFQSVKTLDSPTLQLFSFFIIHSLKKFNMIIWHWGLFDTIIPSLYSWKENIASVLMIDKQIHSSSFSCGSSYWWWPLKALAYVLSLSFVAKLCPTPATTWIVACQAPLSLGLSRQVYWSGLPFPSPGDLPDPGIKPRSPVLQAHSLPAELQGKLLMLAC